MDIAFLLEKYFRTAENVSIDVFDAQTLNSVYQNVIKSMTSHFEIEYTRYQGLLAILAKSSYYIPGAIS